MYACSGVFLRGNVHECTVLQPVPRGYKGYRETFEFRKEAVWRIIFTSYISDYIAPCPFAPPLVDIGAIQGS